MGGGSFECYGYVTQWGGGQISGGALQSTEMCAHAPAPA